MSDCSSNSFKVPTLCGDSEPACNFMWARLQELEQRYEQLERVTKQMLADLDGIVCYSPYGSAEGIKYYRNKLEELGVKMDD